MTWVISQFKAFLVDSDIWKYMMAGQKAAVWLTLQTNVGPTKKVIHNYMAMNINHFIEYSDWFWHVLTICGQNLLFDFAGIGNISSIKQQKNDSSWISKTHPFQSILPKHPGKQLLDDSRPFYDRLWLHSFRPGGRSCAASSILKTEGSGIWLQYIANNIHACTVYT